MGDGEEATAPVPADDLVDLLGLEALGGDRFAGPTPVGGRPDLYGGLVAAQALRAGTLTVPADRHPHSLHGYFVRAGRAGPPVDHLVTRTRDGRSYSARQVVAVQGGDPIATFVMSFHVTEPGSDRGPEPPRWPDPETLEVHHLLEVGVKERPIELRPVPPGTAQPSDAPTRVWMRCRSTVPDEAWVHACVVTYCTDMRTGTAALSSLGLARNAARMSSLDHSVWLHRRGRVDGWLAMGVRTLAAGGGRVLVLGTVHDREGAHLATFTQEAMVREGAPPRPGQLHARSEGT